MPVLEQIADILLIGGAAGAAFYCFILSRRLSRFTDLEKGVGGAIAVLSAQVDDMTRALQSAQDTAGSATRDLAELTGRADAVARKLELLVASMHDIPGASDTSRTEKQSARDGGASDGASTIMRTGTQRQEGEAAVKQALAKEERVGTLFRSRRPNPREAAE
ncbi:hypothetical protein SAMN05216257_104222 [Meinhardsimonia xiamenensis]|jgi:hypothetical protein|uniref:Uncharacterized protein n=1 Tax=Meinhardsimonia xiamenensis TaxID=990712 RepID=A0A1G9EAS8_9RHOB|nr:hypothetical protein [Meinhardsimonia xiamenensis]PRX33856.1 hypothetical protein LV81_02292 [Meinhardsimonia xiamenensis]SDK73198.1 hypothetical protein SAMN05216257_104222 [Meinhardsimonia xiamenensis]